jgi:hypothetical protein
MKLLDPNPLVVYRTSFPKKQKLKFGTFGESLYQIF